MPLLRQNLGFLVKFADRHVNVIPFNPSIVKLGSCPRPLLRQNLGLWVKFAGRHCQTGELPKAPALAKPGILDAKEASPTLDGFFVASRQRKRRRKYVALCTKDEVLLQAVAKEPTRPGYKLVEAVFDSGAEERVSPPRLFPGPVVPSAMSKAGGSYRVANGQRVPTSDSKPCTSQQMKVRRLE